MAERRRRLAGLTPSANIQTLGFLAQGAHSSLECLVGGGLCETEKRLPN